MPASPFTIERVFNAPVEIIWKAITDKDEMKKWYFDLKEFRAEPGFSFSFIGGENDKQYVHLCRVTEAVPNKKLAYTWKYEGFPGESTVTFELFPEGEKTRLKLTHEGLETFPANNPDFRKENFEKGWNGILDTNLKEYIAKTGSTAGR